MARSLTQSRLCVSLASFPPSLPHTLHFKVHPTCHNYFTGVFRPFFSEPICLLFLGKTMSATGLGLEQVGRQWMWWRVSGDTHSPWKSSEISGDNVVNPQASREIKWPVMNIFSRKYCQQMLKVNCCLFSSTGAYVFPLDQDAESKSTFNWMLPVPR